MIQRKIRTFIPSLLSTIVFTLSVTSWALTPEQVVVVANSKALHSVDLAKYYMKKRMVPSDNLIEVKAPTAEHCSREDYQKYIASPVKAFLEKKDPEGDKFRCLVTMYGIPLRVHSPQLTADEREQLSTLQNNVIPLPPRSKRLNNNKVKKSLKD
jgi:uncharacterized protein (TIGR03790 family)